MKKQFLFLLAIALILACSKDEDEYDNYKLNLGIYENTGDGETDFQVNLDNGDIVVPGKVSSDLFKFNDGERVLVYYTPLENDSESDNQTINSAIHYVEEILTKGIITLTDDITDSIGNTPIHVHEEDIWFSKHYLNIYFSYYGYDRTHYLNMIKYENDSVDDEGRLFLEFRHNDNGDYYSYAYDGLVSFDMNSLHTVGSDSLPITVKVEDFDGEVLLWKGTYYFDETAAENKMIEFQNKSSLVR